jgi:autophagy-related protein 13
MFSIGKDESKKYSGVKIALNSSPQISFSRSSSRSYQDEFDDTDFTCPFDVDDDDTTDPGSRYFVTKIRRGLCFIIYVLPLI